MRYIKTDNSTRRSVFWLNHICAIIFNLFGIFSAGSVKYSDDIKNKLKWAGFWLGLIQSFLIIFGIRLLLLYSVEHLIWKMVLGLIFILIFIVCQILLIIYRDKLFNALGDYERKIEKIGNDIIKEISNSDFQIRYSIEYRIIKDKVLLNDEEFKAKLFDKDKMKDTLFALYNKMKCSDFLKDDFDVLYSEDKTVVVLKLPSTEETALCNMIGILLGEQNRFFAYTNKVVEWSINNNRTYYESTINSSTEFLNYLLAIKEESK